MLKKIKLRMLEEKRGILIIDAISLSGLIQMTILQGKASRIAKVITLKVKDSHKKIELIRKQMIDIGTRIETNIDNTIEIRNKDIEWKNSQMKSKDRESKGKEDRNKEDKEKEGKENIKMKDKYSEDKNRKQNVEKENKDKSGKERERKDSRNNKLRNKKETNSNDSYLSELKDNEKKRR
jgi:hypothetical protein